MSAGAPFSIWRARTELAANENRTGIDVSFVNPSPSSCSTLVNDAAANTVIGALSNTAATAGLAKPNNIGHAINPAANLFIGDLHAPSRRSSSTKCLQHAFAGLRRVGIGFEARLRLVRTCKHRRQFGKGPEVVTFDRRIDDPLDPVISWNDRGIA